MNLIDKTTLIDYKGNHYKIDPYTWVEKVLAESNIDILNCDRALLESKFVLLAGKRPKPVQERQIRAALDVIEHKAKEAKKEKLQKDIAYKAPNDLLLQYVSAISKNKNKSFEAAKVGHFIWQIKRKIFGLPVADPMMLVLTGPQAGGKSFTIENQLCNPVKDYIGKYDFAIFDQNFMLALYEHNFVIFFDELSKMNRADANKLKHIISTSTLNDRVINTDRHRQYRQNATLVGTSNDPLDEQLQDTTGNRRFCEIQTLPTEQFKRNHKILESIDYVKMWQGVNENAPSPIVPFKETLSMEQVELTPQHHIEDFVDDMLSVDEKSTFTPIANIDEAYNRWCGNHGVVKRLTRRVLSKKLQELGMQPTKKKDIRGLEVSLKQFTAR